MKKIIVFSIVFGFACTNNLNSNKTNKFEINQELALGKTFYVNDSTQYSSGFIQELRGMLNEYESIKLVDNKIFMSRKSYGNESGKISVDTLTISSELPLNIVTKYKTVVDSNKRVELQLVKTNLTTFTFDLKENDSTIIKGEVYIPGFFMLGEETMDDGHGNVYGVRRLLGVYEIDMTYSGDIVFMGIDSIHGVMKLIKE